MNNAVTVAMDECRGQRKDFDARAMCYRCGKAASVCICDAITAVANRTGVVILQHRHESRHPIGTTRIARLGLERVRVDTCAPWEDNATLLASVPTDAMLLYPSPGAVRVDELAVEERPEHLIVIDGTWFQAKKIYDASPALQRLRAVTLPPGRPSDYRIRREPKRHYLSTIEAIVRALRVLEPETEGLEGLHAVFSLMIDRQLAFIRAASTTTSRYAAGSPR